MEVHFLDGPKIDVEASRTYVEVCDTWPAAVFAQARPRHRIADVALRAATEKWGRDGGGTVTITSLSSSPAWRFEKGRTGSDQVVRSRPGEYAIFKDEVLLIGDEPVSEEHENKARSRKPHVPQRQAHEEQHCMMIFSVKNVRLR